MDETTTPILDLSVKGEQTPETPEEESPSSSSSAANAEFSSFNITSTSMGSAMRIPQPFKAYPKDPLSVAVNVATAEALLGKDSADAYMEFRKKMLAQVQVSYTNKNMRRQTQRSPMNLDDPCYLEKRRKNNEAAKRSRDARRAKEDEIAIRCAFLEQENLKLKCEIAALRSELERLRSLHLN